MGDNIILDPIKNQLNLINEAIAIGQGQLKSINKITEIKLPNSTSDKKRAIELNFTRLYTENFWDLTIFILERLRMETKKNIRYYQGQVRNLIETYAKLAYILTQAPRKKLELLLAQQLYEYSFWYKNAGMAGEKRRFFNQDKNFRVLIVDVIKEDGFSFPKIEKFSKKQLERLKCNFPSVEEIFNYCLKDYQENHADFKINPKGLYRLYRFFSKYIHGEVFVSMRIKGDINYKFWIISTVTVFSRLMLELIDEKVLSGNHKTEIVNWIKSLQKTKTDFTKYWEICRLYY